MWIVMIVNAEGKKEYYRMLSNILLYQTKCVLQKKKTADLIHREYIVRHCNLDLIKEEQDN